MAILSTTEVCQIMPQYLKARNNFSGCRFQLSCSSIMKHGLSIHLILYA